MTIRRYFIYIAIIAVLLVAWYHSASVKDNIVRNLKDVRGASPFTDDRIEGIVKLAIDR